MTYFGIILALIIMAAMVYLALDKKSNFHTRVASLGALALMIITIIICLFIVFTDHTVPVDPSVLIVGAVVEEVDDGGNDIWIIFIVIFVLAAVFAVIAIHSMREHKKHIQKTSENSKQISKHFDY